jgi:uncharacterized protein YndB with AHSA1/START domain
METIEFKVPPVIKTVTYAGSPEDAFDRFTLDIGRWWPLATHSLGKSDNALSVGFERLEAGGALVEQCRSGDRYVWGSITDIRRPRLVSFTWHVGRSQDAAQLIEVTFDPNEDGTTKVTLTHSGWERLGDGALEAQQSYNTGWDPVLARYVTSGEDQR